MAHICRRPILGILLLACPSAVSSGQSQPDTAQYDAVNDSFSLSVTEYLDPPFAGARDRGPSLYLRATTRRNSGCGGLGMSVRFSRRRVDVYLAGVPRRPGPCASDMGPATGIVRLPPQAGVYDLIIRRPDGVSDTYKLLVTDTLTETLPLVARYTTLTPAQRWRARRNTLNMTCTLPWKDEAVDSTQAWVCTDFARWLGDSLGMRPFRFADGPAKPFPDAPPQQWGDVLYYEYSRAVDFRHSYALLQRFSRRYMARKAPNASVALTNWRGAQVTSYRCRSDQQWCQPSNEFPPW